MMRVPRKTFVYRSLEAAVLIALAALPARATCQASIIGNLTVHDKTTAASVSDPQPLTPGDAVDGIADNATSTSVPPPPGGFPIAGEGKAERGADLLIYDATGTAGVGFCFNPGETITLTFNGLLSVPGPGMSLASVAYMDTYDSRGAAGLSISSATVGQHFVANSVQTVVTIRIAGGGTSGGVLYGNASGAVGSALRIKNLRVDATTVIGNSPTAVNVFVRQGTATVPVILAAPGGLSQSAVATKLLTVNNTQQPAIPSPGGVASGVQSSGQGLRGGAQGFSFTPGFASAFRPAAASCQASPANCSSQVSNDVATAATSLTFSVTGIPSGVTVTFPPRIDMTAANTAANAVVFAARGGTLTNAGRPGSLVVTYDAISVGASPGTVQIETADFADAGTSPASASNPNCAEPNSGSNCDAFPKIGVMVGQTSGFGTAQITVAIGPGESALFVGDDVAPSSTPRYAGSSTPGGGLWPGGGNSNTVFTRYIVPLHDFFFIAPTRTTLLFPFVSTVGGFNTGISVVNTCQDTAGTSGNSVYGTFSNSACNQAGGITFFFFGFDPSNGMRVQASIRTDVTVGGMVPAACRGFDALGRIPPGAVAGCSVAALLPLIPGLPRSFEGYIVAVTAFNNAHGFSAQFDAAGIPFGSDLALVMSNSNRPSGAEALSH